MAEQPGKRTRTKRDQMAAERRDQLLAAAKSLFAEKGYHATSTRMICQKIGMADGLLYHYFPGGKMEMLQTIIVENHDRRVLSVDETRFLTEDDPNVPLQQKLLSFIKVLYEILNSDPELLRIQFREQELLDRKVMEYVTETVRERRNLLAKLLERRAELGQIRQMDFEMAATEVMSVNMIAMFRVLSGIDMMDGNVETFRERMIDHLLDGWKIE